MKQSVGQSISIEIIAIFIVIMFAFIIGTLNYAKAFKVNSNIEKILLASEGYNDISKAEITKALTGLGYVQMPVTCSGRGLVSDGNNGVCIYYVDEDSTHYSYKITTYITLEVPIIGQTIRVPINSKTDPIYRFSAS